MLAVLAASSFVWAQGRGGGRGAARRPRPLPLLYELGAVRRRRHSAQYTPLDIVNRSNVADLEVAWTYPIGENSAFIPLIVDGVMYTAVRRAVVALDAATGADVWRHPVEGAIGGRGFNYWESDNRSDRRLLFLNAGFLTASMPEPARRSRRSATTDEST